MTTSTRNAAAPRRRSRVLLPGLLATVILLAGIASSQSSTAYWNDSAMTEGLSITAGTAGLEVAAPTAASGTLLIPGTALSYQDGTLRLTGDVAQTLSVTRAPGDDISSALTTTIGVVASGEICTPTLEVPAGGSISLGAFAAGSDLSLCASVLLPETDIGNGGSTSVALAFEGTQQ